MKILRQGQVAIVTGAATGIGFALAKAFAGRGLRVVLCDIDADGVARAANHLRDHGATVLGISTDVADRSAVRAMKEQVLQAYGAVDILCNNAGVYHGVEPLWTIDLAEWRRLFETNYWGIVNGLQEFVPLFLRQGHGHVVNTASMSGLTTVPGSADYGSAKHALVALTETLRADLDLAGASAIGVTLLCPATVRTEMGERALRLLANQTEAERAVGSGPSLASVVLNADDLASAALDGIERKLMYVTPTPGSYERFLKRVRPIMQAFESTAT
jgi:NAD(P)-dependent dehydrogenase (short-subunit alcohol dehydrogenase family)